MEKSRPKKSGSAGKGEDVLLKLMETQNNSVQNDLKMYNENKGERLHEVNGGKTQLEERLNEYENEGPKEVKAFKNKVKRKQDFKDLIPPITPPPKVDPIAEVPPLPDVVRGTLKVNKRRKTINLLIPLSQDSDKKTKKQLWITNNHQKLDRTSHKKKPQLTPPPKIVPEAVGVSAP